MAAEMNMTINHTRTFTPQEVAKLFCQLDNDGQAAFFNSVAAEVDTWDRQFCFQMQAVIDSCKLDAGGIDVMRTIGEYGQAALPCKHVWEASYDAEENVDGFDCTVCGAHQDHQPQTAKEGI